MAMANKYSRWQFEMYGNRRNENNILIDETTFGIPNFIAPVQPFVLLVKPFSKRQPLSPDCT